MSRGLESFLAADPITIKLSGTDHLGGGGIDGFSAVSVQLQTATACGFAGNYCRQPEQVS